MCIYIYIHIYGCMYNVCLFINHSFICLCVYIYIYTHTHYAYIYIYIYTHMYI